MTWDVTTRRPKTTEEMVAAWKQGLAARGAMDPAAWMRAATELRAMAAALRDSHLSLSPQHTLLAQLVDEISVHLPERRTGPR